MNLKRIFFLVFVFLCMTLPIQAGFSPSLSQKSITPSLGQSSTFLTITNDSEDPLAIDIKIEEVMPDSSGGLQKKTSEDEFLVVPQQVLLLPKTEKLVSIQWIGTLGLKSRNFKLTTIQVPFKNNKKTQEVSPGKTVNIRLVYTFELPLEVLPEQGYSNVQVESIKQRGEGNTKKWFVYFKNTGTQSELIKSAVFLVDNQEITVPLSKRIYPDSVREIILEPKYLGEKAKTVIWLRNE